MEVFLHPSNFPTDFSKFLLKYNFGSGSGSRSQIISVPPTLAPQDCNIIFTVTGSEASSSRADGCCPRLHKAVLCAVSLVLTAPPPHKNIQSVETLLRVYQRNNPVA